MVTPIRDVYVARPARGHPGIIVAFDVDAAGAVEALATIVEHANDTIDLLSLRMRTPWRAAIEGPFPDAFYRRFARRLKAANEARLGPPQSGGRDE